jgi:hypothetical protein
MSSALAEWDRFKEATVEYQRAPSQSAYEKLLAMFEALPSHMQIPGGRPWCPEEIVYDQIFFEFQNELLAAAQRIPTEPDFPVTEIADMHKRLIQAHEQIPDELRKYAESPPPFDWARD